MSVTEEARYLIGGLYTSFGELMSAKLPEREEVITGIYRGEVTELVSVTDVGKTTLMLNACIALTVGKPFYPLVTEKCKPVKILYIDFESPASGLRHDIAVMLDGIGKLSCLDGYLIPWVDGLVNGGDPLSLEQPEHFSQLMRIVQEHDIGLVIIDTVSSAFNIFSENDNAEIKRKVMRPLCGLARLANCAVIFAHHHGKPFEGGSGEKAYYGRGASAFGALARTVLTLQKDKTKGEGT